MKKLNVICAAMMVLAVSGVVRAEIFGTGDNQFTIDFVFISGNTNPNSGSGIVNNDYRMGTYEITNGQWNKFVAAYGTVTGAPSAAYDADPQFTGTNVPTNNVSWYEAAQFVNWLNTSTGHQAAYKFTGTQGTTDYTFDTWSASEADGTNLYRNKAAKYFLPTEDEWVKAGYWNGTNLQTYATKPGETLFQGNGTNGGWNYYDLSGGPGPAGPATGPWDVGSGSEELNGTFDMMGNVFELMENPSVSGDYRVYTYHGLRSGSYDHLNTLLVSSSRYFSGTPDIESYECGFRVASIPEPATICLLGLGALGLLRRKK